MQTKKKTLRWRRLFTFIAFILVLIMLFTGTFAWQSISQQAVNQTIGIPAPAGGRLHNDRQVVGERHGTREWSAGLAANHDIYVENFEGDEETATTPAFEGRQIFARVRLYEYMEIGGGANLLYDEYGYDTRLATHGGRVRPLIEGSDRDNPSTWTPFIPGNTYTEAFRQYWEWVFGGQKYYMPTFNRDSHSRATDTKGDAYDPQPLNVTATPPEVPNHTGVGQPSAYPPQAGLHRFFEPAASGGMDNTAHTSPVKRWHEDFNTGTGQHAVELPPATHTSRPTLYAEFTTMENWMLTPRVGDYWVLDEDGWAYWAAPIDPNTATGLLLDEVTLTERPQEEWFYDIFVNAQMATAEEWREDSIRPDNWFADPELAPSENAVALMNLITGPNIYSVTDPIGRVLMRRSADDDGLVQLGNDFAWNTETGRVEGFGSYRQTRTGGTTPANANFNADEPLNWVVLDINQTDGRMLLISEKILDNVLWHTDLSTNAWGGSNLRAWLNSTGNDADFGICRGTPTSDNQHWGGFLNTAFSSAERDLIVPANTSAEDDGPAIAWTGVAGWGLDFAPSVPAVVSGDYIFTLSNSEVWHFFGPSRIADEAGWIAPQNITNGTARVTDYAASKGAYRSDVEYAEDNGLWWTRSAGIEVSTVSLVDRNGTIGVNNPPTAAPVGVRPVMWVYIGVPTIE